MAAGTVAERFQDGGQVHAGRGGGGSSASRRPLGTLGAPYISRRVYKTFFFLEVRVEAKHPETCGI